MRPQPSDLYAHPRTLVAEGVRDYGEHTVLDTCLALIEGHDDYELLAMPLSYLGGASARGKLDRGDLLARGIDHWPRTWGVRGLLYVWQPYAAAGVVTALGDSHWRVREMAAKVVVRHHVRDAAEALLPLLEDANPRVSVAALRASADVGDASHLAAMEAIHCDDRSVSVACATAARELRRRVA